MSNLTLGQITSVAVGDGVADDTSTIQTNGIVSSQTDGLIFITTSGLGYECDYVSRRKYNEMHAELTSVKYELEQSRKLALMAKVERDTAISERNMVLQALVKMVETRLLASRKVAAEAEAETPGAQMLRAIAVAQKIDRVR